jgi:hypothetical protein
MKRSIASFARPIPLASVIEPEQSTRRRKKIDQYFNFEEFSEHIPMKINSVFASSCPSETFMISERRGVNARRIAYFEESLNFSIVTDVIE